MPRGASPKREREYKELEHKFKEEGRYLGREEEVAARIVNKQRAETGEAETTQGHSRHPTRRRTMKKAATRRSSSS
jgi:hypothetical protein